MSSHAHAPDEPTTAAQAEAQGDIEGRWLTYREFGRIRGIGGETAKKLAIRQGWRRVPGNDGANRVLVPREWLKPLRALPQEQPHPPARDSSSDIRDLQASFAAALQATVDAHAVEVRALRDQLDLTLAMAGERAKAMAALETAITKAEAAQAALQAELDAALAGRHEAQEAAEALRVADDARRGLGRWSRLRRAWRGQ